MSLLIVESPAKARKIQSYLKHTDIQVLSSFGHITNLDTSKLDDMIQDNFTPLYKPSKDKSKVIRELKQAGKGKDIILAADDDREGDAIAWHCGNLFRLNYQQNNRIIFHEISKKAIETALSNKHKLNMNSVESQRCRQLLDLIIGFKLSPLLWKHIQTSQKGLSAGRVQSTLLRMLQEHETEISNFRPETYYDFKGSFQDKHSETTLDAEFEFTDDYYESVEQIDGETFLPLFRDNRTFQAMNHKQSKEKRTPPKPFITSSLQQTAQSELGFSIKMTMDIAQKLYENGKITYMRTDSTYVSPEFKQTIQQYVSDKFGSTYYREPKQKKVKGAQEAHECIRPTQITTELSDKYKPCDHKLYQLIKKRTIMSHMKHAVYDVSELDLQNKATQQIGKYKGKVKQLSFEGFLKYNNVSLPETKLSLSDIKECELLETTLKETETNPPQYYNESSVVKQLELSGVGRPSTYASIVSTLYNRNYTVVKDIESKEKQEPYCQLNRDDTIVSGCLTSKTPYQKKRILMTDLGQSVLEYLLQHFSDMICVDFTARVEQDLDLISQGETDFITVIRKVYDAFSPSIKQQMSIRRTTKKDAVYIGDIEIKQGKYGPYMTIDGTHYGLTNYLTYKKQNVSDLTEDDLRVIQQYPKVVGTHKGNDIQLLLGPYGIYMKYKDKNYRINRLKDHKLPTLLQLLR